MTSSTRTGVIPGYEKYVATLIQAEVEYKAAVAPFWAAAEAAKAAAVDHQQWLEAHEACQEACAPAHAEYRATCRAAQLEWEADPQHTWYPQRSRP